MPALAMQSDTKNGITYTLYKGVYTKEVDLEKVAKEWQLWGHGLFKKPDLERIIAENSKGEAVGAIAFKTKNDKAKICYLEVSPAYQRQGIGRELFTRTNDYLFQNQDCQKISWKSEPDAVTFYTKMGARIKKASDNILEEQKMSLYRYQHPQNPE